MYFITGIHVAKDGDTEIFNESRCFGFYSSLNVVAYTVETNSCDIFENYYKYVVIEKINEGIYPEVVFEYWYMWDKAEQSYVAAQKPLCIEHYCNFALG